MSAARAAVARAGPVPARPRRPRMAPAHARHVGGLHGDAALPRQRRADRRYGIVAIHSISTLAPAAASPDTATAERAGMPFSAEKNAVYDEFMPWKSFM